MSAAVELVGNMIGSNLVYLMVRNNNSLKVEAMSEEKETIDNQDEVEMKMNDDKSEEAYKQAIDEVSKTINENIEVNDYSYSYSYS